MPAPVPGSQRAFERALRRFDRNPLRSIAAAQGGNWDELQVVTKKMVDGKFDFHIYEAATKMFQHLIRLQLADKDDSVPLECGITSVLGLITTHASAKSKNPLEGQRIHNLISEEGRDLADWFVHATNKILADDVDPFTAAYTEFLCTFLRDCLHFIKHAGDMLRRDDIFDIIIRLWVRAGTKKDKVLEEQISLAMSTSLTYFHFLTLGDRAHRVASQLNCSPETVIRVASYHLRRDVISIKKILSCPLPFFLDLEHARIRGHLLFLYLLIPGISGYSYSERNRSGETYNAAFIEQGGLEIILGGLVVLLEQMHLHIEAKLGPHPQHLDFVAVMFGLLVNSLQLISKASSIIRVLDAGLIAVLISVTPIFDKLSELGQSAVSKLVVEMLAPWLNFTSVLRHINKFSPMKKLAKTGKLPKSMCSTGLQEYWTTFSTQLAKRDKHIQDIMSSQAKQIIRCENPDCNHSGPREDFQKCAGCEIEHYCSPKCQSIVWKKQDHKTHCLHAIELFKATHLPEPVDLRYLSRIVFDEYHLGLEDGRMPFPPPGYGVLFDLTQPLSPAALRRQKFITFYKLDLGAEDKEATYQLCFPSATEAKGAIKGTDRFVVYMRVKYSLGFQIHSFLVIAKVTYGKALPAVQ